MLVPNAILREILNSIPGRLNSTKSRASQRPVEQLQHQARPGRCPEQKQALQQRIPSPAEQPQHQARPGRCPEHKQALQQRIPNPLHYHFYHHLPHHHRYRPHRHHNYHHFLGHLHYHPVVMGIIVMTLLSRGRLLGVGLPAIRMRFANSDAIKLANLQQTVAVLPYSVTGILGIARQTFTLARASRCPKRMS